MASLGSRSMKAARPGSRLAALCGCLLTAAWLQGCTAQLPRQPEVQGMRAQSIGTKVSGRQPSALSEREEDIVPTGEAASAVASVPGVNEACVVVHRREAYAAVALDEPEGELTPELRERIDQAVRLSGTEVRAVHVTAQASFLRRLQSYTENVREGRSAPGFNREFPGLVKTAFPDAAVPPGTIR
ncbi:MULTISPECIES: YhcN/YlaJ family sporulation lipoprotein [Paenibacillus]|uniref:YhcN/YlaJ family sporulation lipoprotein n=1 Tax=Paenibacillus TaxID=44249 RepID=UPI0022B8DC5B|nr:YhcN/YlaJ family sporulation lipoprotein [Paenibacillus caseinilyticus]MCZ8520605.1 YhcN/YlaJ family sporulation lipoprotein [Paenibacillus caseinilyticus]